MTLHILNLIVIMICGFFATLAMTLTMGFINGLDWAKADMVRAIGSIYTKKPENAFWPGAAAHFTAGSAFALAYAVLASAVPIDLGNKGTVLLTSLASLFHGIAVGVMLSVIVAEHHPLPEFREAGGAVIFAHIFGHVVYGITLGFLFAATQVNLKII